jgi:hypothetical protein
VTAKPAAPKNETRDGREPVDPGGIDDQKIDYERIADAIGGYCGKLIRFMKGRTGASHQEIEENVYDGSHRAWNTIKTLACRTNSKILETMGRSKMKGPRPYFKADQRSYRITKQVSGSFTPETPLKLG